MKKLVQILREEGLRTASEAEVVAIQDALLDRLTQSGFKLFRRKKPEVSRTGRESRFKVTREDHGRITIHVIVAPDFVAATTYFNGTQERHQVIDFSLGDDPNGVARKVIRALSPWA